MNWKKVFIGFSILSLIFIGAAAINVPQIKATSFYPSAAHALLSNYYRLPGQSFMVFGRTFLPNEQVIIEAFGQHYNTVADGTGNFTSGAIIVPFSAIN